MKPKFAIGIDVGGTFIKGALVDRSGRIIFRRKVPTEASSGNHGVLNHVVSLIGQLEKTLKAKGQILGVGLGIAGLVDFRRGIVLVSPNLPGWRNFPVLQTLSKVVNYPLFLENDANAAALGEKWMGAARKAQSFCFLTLGTGVGGGLVMEGRIWHGAKGMAGEIGHMIIDPHGPPCKCGNQGCLETYASVNALRRMVMEAFETGRKTILGADIQNDSLDGKAIFQAAQKEDALALEVFERMGFALGVGMASLVNLLNPEMIVLGGGLSAAWRYFIPALRREFKSRAFLDITRGVKIVRATAGENAGILGAAHLVWQCLGKPNPPQKVKGFQG